MEDHKLPDVLGPNLKVVFCGTAVSKQSAERRGYYAGDGNKFWPTLWSVGLTPIPLKPQEYASALNHRIGLTDLAKRISGPDTDIKPDDIDIERVRSLISEIRPYALAFTSQKAGRYFLECKPSWGLQEETVGPTKIYVLPSTSGLANAHWNEGHWQAMANDLRDK